MCVCVFVFIGLYKCVHSIIDFWAHIIMQQRIDRHDKESNIVKKINSTLWDLYDDTDDDVYDSSLTDGIITEFELQLEFN